MTTEPVKAPRPYDASRRQQQAAEARRAVLSAAHQLLLQDGYAHTTVPAVAAAAGVSAEFVYKNVGRKAALLAAVLDVAIAGDDAPVAMADRPGIRQLRELDTASDVIEGYIRLMAPVQARVVPLLMLAAQSADPDAVALLTKADSQRLTGMTGLARHLHALGGLHPHLSIERTRDLLWAYSSPQLYDLLVARRGWPPVDYEHHVRDALLAALLTPGKEANSPSTTCKPADRVCPGFD